MSLAEYHPVLSSLSWLVGKWESVEAVMTYPTVPVSPLKYKEILEFQPTMENQPFLEYKSDTWHLTKDSKLHNERGYLQLDPESKKAALIVSHFFGLAEMSEGSVENECLCLESKSLSEMSFCKSAATVKLVRKWQLKEGELHSTVLMETAKTPLQIHLQSRYKRMN